LRLGEILLHMRQQNRLLSPLRSLSSVLSHNFLFLLSLLSLPFLRKYNLNKTKQTKKQLGAIRTAQGKWVLLDGREMISKPLMTELLTYLHQGSHWGPQTRCDAVLQACGCIGNYMLSKQVSESVLLIENEQASPETLRCPK
jgi:hypothetical protein